MSDQVDGGTVPAAHIVKGLQYSISTDGKMAMLVFEIADGSRFAITVEVPGLGALASMVRDVMGLAVQRGVDPGRVALIYPKTVQLGHSDDLRGHVLMMMDEGQPGSVTFAIDDARAFGIGTAMKNDVMQRASPQQRVVLMKGERAIITPGMPKIILPGGRA